MYGKGDCEVCIEFCLDEIKIHLNIKCPEV